MIIKSWIYVPVLILFSASLVTCQNNQVQNSDVVNTPTTEKLQENVYKAENEGWLVNVEEAYQISQKTGRPIDVYKRQLLRSVQ